MKEHAWRQSVSLVSDLEDWRGEMSLEGVALFCFLRSIVYFLHPMCTYGFVCMWVWLTTPEFGSEPDWAWQTFVQTQTDPHVQGLSLKLAQPKNSVRNLPKPAHRYPKRQINSWHCSVLCSAIYVSFRLFHPKTLISLHRTDRLNMWHKKIARWIKYICPFGCTKLADSRVMLKLSWTECIEEE